MNLEALVGKKAVVVSSAHSSRYGYIGYVMVGGTILSVDDEIRVFVEKGRFKGQTCEIPLGEASVERSTAESYPLKGEGAWANVPEETMESPDVIIYWEQWQPEG